MTPAMQAARDRVVEAAKAWRDLLRGSGVWTPREMGMLAPVDALLALEAQEKEQADAEG